MKRTLADPSITLVRLTVIRHQPIPPLVLRLVSLPLNESALLMLLEIVRAILLPQCPSTIIIPLSLLTLMEQRPPLSWANALSYTFVSFPNHDFLFTMQTAGSIFAFGACHYRLRFFCFRFGVYQFVLVDKLGYHIQSVLMLAVYYYSWYDYHSGTIEDVSYPVPSPLALVFK